jgi:hypothetical protein
MKKLALLFAFAGFATFASAQTACANKTAACCVGKTECVHKTAACCAKTKAGASADASAATNNVVTKEKSCAQGKAACCAAKAEKAALKTEAQ